MAILDTIEQVTIDLTTDVRSALERKAKGQDIKIYIQGIVSKQALRPNLDDVLTPVRKEFAESGMSADDLDAFMNSVREKAFRDRQNKQPK